MSEGPSINPLMMVSLARNSLVGNTEDIDNNIKPIPSQFALGPGDKVVVVSTDNAVDHDFIAGEILDPEQYATDFPDWEQRLMKSYVLIQWFSAADREGDRGWFSRVKLIKLSDDHYVELVKLREDPDGFTDEPPQWLHSVYDEYMAALHQQDPEKIPAPVQCPECGSTDVELHVEHVTRSEVKAGKLVRDGKDIYVSSGDYETTCTTEVHLHCLGCHAHGELSDEEFELKSLH